MTDFNLALGCLITAHRKRKNLTQVVLAKRTGMSQARISRIESGASLTIHEFLRIAPVLCGTTTTLLRRARHVVDIATKAAKTLTSARVTTADIIPIIASRMP